ncbi:DNA recombination protein RmuC [Sphingomicrobium lutaoense]|uniref:DNA recombination protein RmuC homolog n=1 Tax=Sphingomicrobium lutaoense TaxID=515949 RepID=A0A839YZF3_9SPHN|nr:DNA recombination protein RmuC [Sphingomicrobium lutaoense]MBB3763840.1 DNA recombination protein RmuC [Sphingomicrobium lutaoense]
MDPFLILTALGGLAIGAVIGWLLGKQGAARAEASVESLRMQLDAVREERDAALNEVKSGSAELARLRAEAEHFAQRMKDLEDSKDKLVAQFREVGDKMLEKAQQDFLEKAGARFSEADKESQSKLRSLVTPIQQLLEEQKKKIDAVEKERVDHYAGLKAVVEQVRQGQGQVRDETRNLVNALRSSPKARGRWGEQSLRNVLEQAGLAEHTDYETEVSVDSDEGRLRPDAVVNLPGGRKLVVDAKCSLNAFIDANDEVDDDRRDAHLQAHAASLRNHAQQLGSKSYWAQFDDSADYVVMYIPGEHFLTAALEKDSGLWDWAFEKKVLLATPTNLVAIARTVASVWKQEKLAKEAGQIAQLGRDLHQRIATMAEHVATMGLNLGRANNAYNKMVGSLESQVMTQAKRFEDLGAGSSKELPDLSHVEAAPRVLTKLAAPKERANDEDVA